uniref:Coat protein n=1 Tax=Conidiobolus lamprauges totivirus 1 TaxID=2980980 RepID=A0A977R5I0_9VIRU|nr:coat protein [Conidiobolus lamprauges totivirus 1]
MNNNNIEESATQQLIQAGNLVSEKLVEVKDVKSVRFGIEMEEVIRDMCDARGMLYSSADRYFSGNLAKRVSENINFEAISNFMSLVHRKEQFTVRVGGVQKWNDVHGQTIRSNDKLSARMYPSGRGAMEEMSVSWYNPNITNSRAGLNRLKTENAAMAEEKSFDSGYDRATKRDTTRLRTWLYLDGRVQDMRYLSFLKEGLCSSFVSRAIWKNYLQPDVVEKSSAGGKGRAWVGGVTKSPGTKEMTFTPIPYDQVMDATTKGKISGAARDVFVSRAKNASDLAYDIFALWAGMIPEHGVYTGDVYMILAHISRQELINICYSWGITYTSGPQIIGHVVSYLKKSKYFHLTNTITISSADYIRILDYQAYRRFRYIRAGKLCSLLEMESGTEGSLSLPDAAWETKLASAYSLVELAEDDFVMSPKWHSLETAAYNRGCLLGAGGDYVMQNVCGHWRNLSIFHNSDEIYNLLTAYMDFMLGTSVNVRGKFFWNGIRTSIPREYDGPCKIKGSKFSGNIGVIGSRLVWPQTSFEEEADEELTFKVGTTGGSPQAGYDGEPSHIERCWIIMTRADWATGLPIGISSWWKTEVDLKPLQHHRSVGRAMHEEIGDKLMHPYITRSLQTGSRSNVYAVIDERATICTVKVIRSYSTGSNPYIFWACEAAKALMSYVSFGLGTLELSVIGNFTVSEEVRDFALQGSELSYF